MVNSKDLLEQFIGDRVMVITMMEQDYVDDTSEAWEEAPIVRGPKVFYAQLLGYDNNFVYLGDADIPLLMLNLNEVRLIERDPSGLFGTPEEDMLGGSTDGTLN